MSDITVKFDPSDIFTSAEFGRRAGLSTVSARAWLYRNLSKLPHPLFTLNLGTESKPMTYMVWTQEQGDEILNTYTEQRRKRTA